MKRDSFLPKGRTGRFLAAAIATATVLVASHNASAAPDNFPLGQNARNGAVCRADADYDNPAVQVRGAQAWTINCSGFDTLGHLYSFTHDAEAAVAPDSAWAAQLAKQATCTGTKQQSLTGIGDVQTTSCKTTRGQHGYSVYRANANGGIVIAEGYDAIAEDVQEGLKVVAGAEKPPAILATVSGAGISGTGAARLRELAADSQESNPEYLAREAHLENGAWGFTESERTARKIADNPAASATQRARALLTIAMDLSDEGAFAKADIYIDRAKALIAGMDRAQPLLSVYAQNIQAQHQLNQARYADAKATALRALDALAKIDPTATAPLSKPAGLNESDLISPQVAVELNAGGLAGLIGGTTDAQRIQVYAAQDEYIVGSANAASALGRREEARQLMTAARNRLSESHIALPWLQADIGSGLSRLDLQEGRSSQAISDAGLAVAALDRDPSYADSSHQARVYLALANAEAAAGQNGQALKDYSKAFSIFRQSRGVVGDSAALADNYFKLLVARGETAQFFEAAQTVLSPAAAESVNALNQRLAEGNDTTAMDVLALQNVQRQEAIAEAQLHNDQDAGEKGPRIEAEKKTLSDLRGEEKDLSDKLIDTRYGQLVDPAPVSLAQLQQVLRPDEVYVKTVLLPGSGYAVGVGKDWAKIYAVPLTRRKAHDAVAQLRKPMDENPGYLRNFDVAASRKLYTEIFGPVQAEVARAKRLVYEPDEDLVSLPAGLLVTDDASIDAFKAAQAAVNKGQKNVNVYQATAWLARNANVSLAVSPKAFLAMRTTFKPSSAKKLFAGFGGPDLQRISDPNSFKLVAAREDDAAACERFRGKLEAGLGPLRGASDAVHRIGNQLGAAPNDISVDAAFTEEAIARPDIGDYRILLFETHGLAPQENACNGEPALVTSDGLLDENSILSLKLDADLVVLSACNTGKGSAGASKTGLPGSGEELSGLARDFIFAGSRGLVVSHWEVNTAQMLNLMDRFFQPGAAGTADAMRRAQVSFMDDPTYSHPYYWAAFSLVGDGEKPMPVGNVATAATGP